MKESENIEKLFKDKLEHFEADVNPRVWTNIQKTISASSGIAASSAGKIAIGKITAGIAAIAVVAGSIWYFTSSDKEKTSLPEKQPLAETIVQDNPAPVMNSDQQAPKDIPGNSTAPRQTTHLVSGTSIQSQDKADQDQSISKSNVEDISTDERTSEDKASNSSRPAGKYGNATQGDPGMLRGNRAVNYSSSSGSTVSSAETQDENAAAPAVSIFANTFSGDAPLTVDFMNQSIASALYWDFGDGSSSRESTPTHTFDKPGNYVVTLTAKNGTLSTADKVTIEVRSISSITNIPNIFTPNGDGENDVFHFIMENIASIGVAIINQRNGDLITQWNNLDGNWNGKLKNGNDAPAGVYLYSIQAIGIDGVTHSEKGFVTINR